MVGWSDGKLKVPFSIPEKEIIKPLIGRNVIEEIIKRPEWYDIQSQRDVNSFKNLVPGKAS